MGINMKKLFEVLDGAKPQLDIDRTREIDKQHEMVAAESFTRTPSFQTYTLDGTIKHLASTMGLSHHEEYKHQEKYLQQKKDLLEVLKNFMWEDSKDMSEKLVQENDAVERQRIGEEKKKVDNRIDMLSHYISIQTKYLRTLPKNYTK